jgi:hypothetical protein
MFFGCDLSAGMPFCKRLVERLKLLKEFLKGKKERRFWFIGQNGLYLSLNNQENPCFDEDK